MHGGRDLHPELVELRRNNHVALVLVAHNPVSIFGNQAGRRNELEMKLVCKSVAEAIGKYGDCTAVVIESFEGVGGVGREALTPVVGDEDFVGGVKIVAIARVQSAGRGKVWFSSVFDQQGRGQREPR